MKTTTLHIPARSREVALKVAYAVQAGRITCLAQYRDEGRAARSAEVLTMLHRQPHRSYCVVLETRTVDDGRIPVARIVERAGEIAAAILLTIGAAYAVGLGSLL